MNAGQPTWETVLLQEWISGAFAGLTLLLLVFTVYSVVRDRKNRALEAEVRDTVHNATVHMSTSELLKWLTSGHPDFVTDGHRVDYHDTTSDGCHAHCLCGEMSMEYPGTKGDNLTVLEAWATDHIEDTA